MSDTPIYVTLEKDGKTIKFEARQVDIENNFATKPSNTTPRTMAPEKEITSTDVYIEVSHGSDFGE